MSIVSSNESAQDLFERLELKIEELIDRVESQRQELSDLQADNDALDQELTALRARQTHWEKGLSTLLRKLEDSDKEDILERDSIDLGMERYSVKEEICE